MSLNFLINYKALSHDFLINCKTLSLIFYRKMTPCWAAHPINSSMGYPRDQKAPFNNLVLLKLVSLVSMNMVIEARIRWCIRPEQKLEFLHFYHISATNLRQLSTILDRDIIWVTAFYRLKPAPCYLRSSVKIPELNNWLASDPSISLTLLSFRNEAKFNKKQPFINET